MAGNTKEAELEGASTGGNPSSHPVALRRGKLAPEVEPGTSPSLADRQFIVALARGLEVLAAFRKRDRALGNRELAERTEMPAATVSRVTHTLTRLGYLTFHPREETYDLGPMVLSLGFVALARLNIREVARPLMQRLADEGNVNVGLGIRERHAMINIEACEGPGLIGLRLTAGSRLPITTSSMGRAYVAALDDAARTALIDELRATVDADWPAVLAGFDQAREEIALRGFCTSIGSWQKEINGVAAPLVLPEGGIYVMNLGGPAYRLSADELVQVQGPKLATTVARLREMMVP